ncbi:TSUP family transporter [Mesorhizobium sp. SB112]|uniref:TSUP family transporter n=1 Tax=Mesorhizobium sp. SB112 TaxID=3151853 RepID=UPI003264E9C4
MIPTAAIVVFALLCFVAAYVQTLTGFAFGLLLMGAVVLMNLMPLPEAAIVISLLTLANAFMVLAQGWRNVAMRPFFWALAGAVPMIVAGYVALELLASTSLSVLSLVLGLVIIVSSFQLIRRPSPLDRLSRPAGFIFFGGLGGLMGGLFSTAGPPLVFHFYRQPLAHSAIRETLVAIFAINSLFRLCVVGASGGWENHALVWAIAGLPAVLCATYLARRWPPPLTPSNLRRIAFILLLLSGLSLIVPG